MALWVLFAVMAAVVVYALLRPVLRSEFDARNDTEADLAVYRDQLAQIDDDARRGVVDAVDVESAKLEVSRRILKTAQSSTQSINTDPELGSGGTDVRRVLLGAIGAVPLLTIALYVYTGSPGLGSKPFAGGGKPVTETAEITELVQRVEARLRQFPEDGKGWDVLAPVYFKAERFDDAARAYGTAARILGETSARLAGFAESTVLANGGRVVPEARAAYQKILVAEPDRFEPRFWLALGREQDGDKAAALAEYEALIKLEGVSPEGRAVIAQRITLLGGTPPVPPGRTLGPPNAAANAASSGAATSAPTNAAGTFKGPSQADVKAASEMSEDDRVRMITGMVEGLAARLKAKGDDAPGWQRLIQSYVMLGRPELARAAIVDARKNLVAQPSALAEITALAQSLRLEP
jgi:cytochrome c-type biogenesis protein CcmH